MRVRLAGVASPQGDIRQDVDRKVEKKDAEQRLVVRLPMRVEDPPQWGHEDEIHPPTPRDPNRIVAAVLPIETQRPLELQVYRYRCFIHPCVPAQSSVMATSAHVADVIGSSLTETPFVTPVLRFCWVLTSQL